MNEFTTYEMLLTFSSLITITYMVTEFSKGLKFIDSIKTKYFSFIVAFVLLTIAMVATGGFEVVNIPLYLLSSISVSLAGNGLSDFNNPVDKNSKE